MLQPNRPRNVALASLVLFTLGLTAYFMREPAPKKTAAVGNVEVARDEAMEEKAEPTLEERVPNARELAEAAVVAPLNAEGAAEEPYRDLTVRVFGLDGELHNGVPLFLVSDPSDKRKRMHPDHVRVTGTHRDRWTADLVGKAIWEVRRRPLSSSWSDFDKGKQMQSLTLGIDLPDTEHLWVKLAFESWPTEPVDIYLDENTAAAVAPVRVEVYAADGSPAPGIPVDVRYSALNPEMGHALGMSSYRLKNKRLPVTDEKGVIYLNRLYFIQLGAMRFNQMDVLGDGQPPAMIEPYVQPIVPMLKQIRIAIPPDADLDRTIRIELPLGGRLSARIVDERGRTVDLADSTVRYRIDWEAALGLFGKAEEGEISGDTSENPIDLGWCGMGIALDGNVYIFGGAYGSADAERLGPMRDGDDVEMMLDVGAPFPMLQFTVLDAGGAPLANADVQAYRYFLKATRYDTEDKERAWATHRTDADGSFSILWNARGPTAPMVMDVQATVDGATAWGALAFPPEFTTVIDPAGDALGDQALLEGGTFRLSSDELPHLPVWVKPIVASGAVYDDVGNPLKRVRVDAMGLGTWQRKGHSWTDDKGHFEIVKEEIGPFFLAFSNDDFERDPTDEIPKGSTGLSYSMTPIPPPAPTGSLHGQLLNLPLTIGDHISIRLKMPGKSVRISPNADGGFNLTELPPGKATVTIECAALALEVVQFEDVTVTPGEDLTDPRFESLDLTGLIRLCKFRIEQANGEVISDDKIRLLFPPNTHAKMRVGRRKTREAFVPASYQTIQYGGGDYLSAEASLLDEEVVLTFHPVE